MTSLPEAAELLEREARVRAHQVMSFLATPQMPVLGLAAAPVLLRFGFDSSDDLIERLARNTKFRLRSLARNAIFKPTEEVPIDRDDSISFTELQRDLTQAGLQSTTLFALTSLAVHALSEALPERSRDFDACYQDGVAYLELADSISGYGLDAIDPIARLCRNYSTLLGLESHAYVSSLILWGIIDHPEPMPSLEHWDRAIGTLADNCAMDSAFAFGSDVTQRLLWRVVACASNSQAHIGTLAKRGELSQIAELLPLAFTRMTTFHHEATELIRVVNLALKQCLYSVSKRSLRDLTSAISHHFLRELITTSSLIDEASENQEDATDVTNLVRDLRMLEERLLIYSDLLALRQEWEMQRFFVGNLAQQFTRLGESLRQFPGADLAEVGVDLSAAYEVTQAIERKARRRLMEGSPLLEHWSAQRQVQKGVSET